MKNENPFLIGKFPFSVSKPQRKVMHACVDDTPDLALQNVE
jgi:hypothetical protein